MEFNEEFFVALGFIIFVLGGQLSRCTHQDRRGAR